MPLTYRAIGQVSHAARWLTVPSCLPATKQSSAPLAGLPLAHCDFLPPHPQAVYGVLKEAEHRSTFYIPYWNLPLASVLGEREQRARALLRQLFWVPAFCAETLQQLAAWGRQLDTSASPSIAPVILQCRGSASSRPTWPSSTSA